MKFAPFVYDYISYEDYDCLEHITGYSNPKEYLGFDLPFDLQELNNSQSPRWDELVSICNDYVIRHGIEIVSDKVTYCDLEKGYEEHDVVFSFDGKYYRTVYYCGPWMDPFRYKYPEEVEEIFPHKKMVEVTEYY